MLNVVILFYIKDISPSLSRKIFDFLDDSGCLLGDIMHQHGDELGYIGFKCLADNRSFEAYMGRCEKGEVVSTNATSTCHEIAPYCCQSGKPGNWGATTCVSKKEDCTPWNGDGKLFT